MELDWCLFFRDPRYGLDGRVEIPSNISHLEVKHSNGDDSVKAKIARGHAEQPESSAMRIPAFSVERKKIRSTDDVSCRYSFRQS